MLEIDIDVGRLVTRRRDEALEEHVVAVRVDGGNAETVADRRIGRRAAPLTENAAGAGETDDIVHCEEIGGVGKLGDQRQFVVELALHLGRHAVRVAFARAFVGERGEMAVGCLACGHHFVGIFVGQLVEGEGTGLGDGKALFDGLRIAGEQTRHLVAALEMALGIGGKAQAPLVGGAMLADAGQHIGQRPPVGQVIAHGIGGDQRQARALGERRQGRQTILVAAVEAATGGEMALPAVLRRKRSHVLREAGIWHPVRRQQD